MEGSFAQGVPIAKVASRDSRLILFPLENVSHSADAIPAITVAVEHHSMLAVRLSVAVFAGKQIGAQVAVGTGVDEYAGRFFAEIMDGDDRVVAPVVTQGENGRVSGTQNP